MDSLPVHTVKGVEEALHAVGAEAWFLPAYSPDFNPIEQAWSKVKSWLRRESPPTSGRLVGAIGRALSIINRLEARNYFANAGYALTPTSNPL